MAAARGDTKPCTSPKCQGRMQYKRRLDSQIEAKSLRATLSASAENSKGWVCSLVPEHFQIR